GSDAEPEIAEASEAEPEVQPEPLVVQLPDEPAAAGTSGEFAVIEADTADEVIEEGFVIPDGWEPASDNSVEVAQASLDPDEVEASSMEPEVAEVALAAAPAEPAKELPAD